MTFAGPAPPEKLSCLTKSTVPEAAAKNGIPLEALCGYPASIRSQQKAAMPLWLPVGSSKPWITKSD